MNHDKNGNFIKKPKDIKIQGNIAFVSIWNKGNLHKGIFDKEDVTLIKSLNAFVLRRGYICSRSNGMFSQVSRILVNCPEDFVVDHINGNKLDNRKSNLRIITQLENSNNRTIMNKNNRSGVACVIGKRYGASVVLNGKRKFLGTFTDIEDAKKAVENASGRKIKPANKQSKTGFRGIYPIKHKVWVGKNGKRHYLGSFDTMEEAIAAKMKFEQQ